MAKWGEKCIKKQEKQIIQQGNLIQLNCMVVVVVQYNILPFLQSINEFKQNWSY